MADLILNGSLNATRAAAQNLLDARFAAHTQGEKGNTYKKY